VKYSLITQIQMKFKTTNLKYFLFLLFCVAFYNSNAQTIPSYNCVYDPDESVQASARQVITQMNAFAGKNSQARKAALTGVVKIPLVVHVIEPSTSSSLITDAQIATMVANLNASFRATGAFAGSTDIEIEYELAKQDPTCAATTGITRYDASGNATYVSKGVFAAGVPWATVQSWKTWDKNLYVNVWIVNKLDNGAGGVGGPGDGLIVLASAATTANEQISPHEIAHYFGLAHPFLNDPTPGTTTNCNCGDGDGLADTPLLINYGLTSTCPHVWGCSPANQNIINPCTNAVYGNIQENFMNYLNVGCGKRFTPNQKTFMRTYLENNHASLLTSPVLQTTPITPIAILTTPTSFCVGGTAFPNIPASCLCSTVQSTTINGTAQTNLSFRPTLSAGQSVNWTYVLTCANGLTSTKNVLFYNPGVANVQTVCGSGNMYSVTYTNASNYTVTTSAGTISGNSVINIPVGTNVTLTVSDAAGCGGNQQTITSPCCSSGPISLAACVPVVSGAASSSGISAFTFNTINSTSALANIEGNYVDRTCNQQTTVTAGNSYAVTIDGFGFKQMFIDFNNNGLLTDSGENVVVFNTAGSNYAGNITIPTTATKGVPLRVRVKSDNWSATNPCTLGSGSASGQIEDFTMTITVPPVTITSIISGNWENITTWDLNRIPIASDKVVIAANHQVSINSTNVAIGKNIEYKTNAKIIFNVGSFNLKVGY
jgi:GEVED domain/Pregnancy-associated plasma protein-A